MTSVFWVAWICVSKVLGVYFAHHIVFLACVIVKWKIFMLFCLDIYTTRLWIPTTYHSVMTLFINYRRNMWKTTTLSSILCLILIISKMLVLKMFLQVIIKIILFKMLWQINTVIIMHNSVSNLADMSQIGKSEPFCKLSKVKWSILLVILRFLFVILLWKSWWLIHDFKRIADPFKRCIIYTPIDESRITGFFI